MLSEDYLDALCELDNIALGAVAVSISKMSSLQVKMIKPKAQVCSLMEGLGKAGYNSAVSLVFELRGSVFGETAFVFEKEELDRLLETVDPDKQKALDKVGEAFSQSILENISMLIPGAVEEFLFVGEKVTQKKDEQVVFIQLQFKVQDKVDSTLVHIVPVDVGETIAKRFLGEVSSQLDEFSTKIEREGERQESVSLSKQKSAGVDVMVSILVRLAQRKMKFLEMWELEPGSVIEFPQYISEPVKVLVKNKVIARGQVVTVGEKFGVRITEVSDYAKSISS